MPAISPWRRSSDRRFSLHSDLRWSTLAHEPFRLLVPRHEDGNDWAELLSSEPFVRYDRASFGGRQVDRFLRAAHLSVQRVCELDELDAIVRLVANGVGGRAGAADRHSSPLARGGARNRPRASHIPS